ncbi:MAG TPA: GNAT family N-acetyltransferase, partial [Tepidisphaeraceae bacterium]|nr:GNAT family N-acetyltransferase [Tepidisphaeraceae bacterium]
RTMLARAVELCARSQFKHVLLSVAPDNAAATALYARFGFRKIGEFVQYVAPATVEAERVARATP